MDKLTMAHECAMKLIGNPTTPLKTISDIVKASWSYADAMQAEAEKRKPSGLPEALKEEWQPDWSQAPDEANMITIDACGVGQYWVMYQGNEPKLGDNRWFDDYRGRYLGGFEPVGFNGNWKESLRKRPQ